VLLQQDHSPEALFSEAFTSERWSLE